MKKRARQSAPALQSKEMYEKQLSEYLSKHGFEAMSLKAVLFDMDGVLFDSMPRHAKAWLEVCRNHGLNISPQEAYLHEGRTGDDTIDIFARRFWGRPATAAEKREIYDEKCRIFNAYLAEAPQMPGARELLAKVRDEGLKIAVVTGSGQESLLSRLEHGYHGFFHRELVVSSHDTQRGKPFPDPYLKGLEKAGVAANEAVVVENAPLGVEAAARAGIFTIAVNTGPLPPQTLSDAGANLVFPSMRALADAWPLWK